MASRTSAAWGVLALALGCDALPGRPRPGSVPVRPSEVMDFSVLYAANCAGCHGTDTAPGAAVPLADPVYLAFADGATLRRVTAEGVPGTAMPAFARSHGGSLSDEQVTSLVRGIRGRWTRSEALGSAVPPRYAPDAPGDPDRGAQVYTERCSSCHGPTGEGGERGGSIVDGSYLALVSDQSLRTAVVVGRPALGMPDWRGGKGGRPLTTRDVDDLVAWLVARRPELPGQPYPSPNPTGGPDDG